MVRISKELFYSKDLVGNNVNLKNASCTWDETFAYWRLANEEGFLHEEDIFKYNISRLFNTHPNVKLAPHEPKDPFIWKIGMTHKMQITAAMVTEPEVKLHKQPSGNWLTILPKINGIVATDY